jgi:hypothetical protein
MEVAILLAVFVSSILLLPAVFLLWMWNNETPTPLTNKGKETK